MKVCAMIPARYAATRFPAKLMQSLGNKTVIRHTYENTVATQLFDEVIVATDSDVIYQEITSHGGKAVMSKRQHESGSDRIADNYCPALSAASTSASAADMAADGDSRPKITFSMCVCSASLAWAPPTVTGNGVAFGSWST